MEHSRTQKALLETPGSGEDWVVLVEIVELGFDVAFIKQAIRRSALDLAFGGRNIRPVVTKPMQSQC